MSDIYESDLKEVAGWWNRTEQSCDPLLVCP